MCLISDRSVKPKKACNSLTLPHVPGRFPAVVVLVSPPTVG